MIHRTLIFAAMLAALLGVASTVHAQSNATLMLKPWSDETSRVEFQGDAMVTAQSHVKGDDAGDQSKAFDLRQYRASGRARLDPADERRISFGFDMKVLDYDSDLNRSRLNGGGQVADQAVAFGIGIGEFDGWQVAAIAGLGFGYQGGEDDIVETEAFYPKGDVIVSKKLDEKSTLTFALDYNRNRSIFPDLPLPYVSYYHNVNDAFGFSAGFPLTSIWWLPIEGLRLEAGYIIPFTFDASISYRVIDPLKLYASLRNDYDAFLTSDDDRDRRLFFEQRRVEAGVVWKVCDNADLTIAGGYAFGQKFLTGWDARDTTTYVALGDEPYLRVGLSTRF